MNEELLAIARKICGFNIRMYIGHGTRSDAVYVTEQDDILKLYQGSKYPISLLMEVDIVMRLRHPMIVHGYKIITRNQCGMKNFNHVLILEKVNCIGSNMTFNDRLKNTLLAVGGLQLLLQNGYVHTDLGHNNECNTDDGFKIIDFNGDIFVGTDSPRIKLNPYVYLILFINLGPILNYDKFIRYMKRKKSRPSDIKINYEVLPHEKQLLYDFVWRTFDPYNMLSLEEMPTHPLFANFPYIKGEENPRYVNFSDWPARKYDYHAPWRIIIPEIIREYMFYILIDHLFDSIDLYYRFLPFIQTEDELLPVAWNCLYIVVETCKGQQRFNYDINVMDNIVGSLNGNIRSQWIHSKCLTLADYVVCWELFALPYNDYMQLIPERFNEVVPISGLVESVGLDDFMDAIVNLQSHPLTPSFNGQISYDIELVNKLKTPSIQSVKYIFSKLHTDELYEFLDMYAIQYEKIDVKPKGELDQRWYLADIAERLHSYLVDQNINSVGPVKKVALTWPVMDLIHSKHVVSTRQYELTELQNMDDHQINELASSLEIYSGNLRERVIRILRMNYLIRDY